MQMILSLPPFNIRKVIFFFFCIQVINGQSQHNICHWNQQGLEQKLFSFQPSLVWPSFKNIALLASTTSESVTVIDNTGIPSSYS